MFENTLWCVGYLFEGVGDIARKEKWIYRHWGLEVNCWIPTNTLLIE